jgi:hypothetical protein
MSNLTSAPASPAAIMHFGLLQHLAEERAHGGDARPGPSSADSACACASTDSPTGCRSVW